MRKVNIKLVSIFTSFLLVILSLVLVYLSKSSRFNDEEYARMMAVHHSQAVELSLYMVSNGVDSDLRVIATDALLTQQNQVGRFQQFLDERGARRVLAPGLVMDGMLAREDIESFKNLLGLELDLRYIDLMITHHKGGVAMSKSSLALGLSGEMERLAKSVINSQLSEIDVLLQVKDRLLLVAKQ